MPLVTQADLAKHFDLTRQRISQLVKQEIFTYADTEHKLLDLAYCEYRYEKYRQDNLGHVEDRAAKKEEKHYQSAKARLESELRARLNTAYDKAVPTALETFKTDFEYTDEQLNDADDAMQMFYSELLAELTGSGLTTYDEPGNPERINDRNRKADVSFSRKVQG